MLHDVDDNDYDNYFIVPRTSSQISQLETTQWLWIANLLQTSVESPLTETTLHYMDCFPFVLFQFLYLLRPSSRTFIHTVEAGVECSMTHSATWRTKAVLVGCVAHEET
jgi:hypothetical protein